MTGISKMLAFIAELRDNNNREWFAAVKPEYEAIRKECYGEIDKLINLISAFDDRLVGVEAKECVYRIYRDIRFSADKSPFKTHFGIVLGKGGRKCWDAAYYLHIEPGGWGCGFRSSRCLPACGTTSMTISRNLPAYWPSHGCAKNSEV